MTEAERALIRNLTAAALPLAAQLIVALIYVVLYWCWSRRWYGRVDAAARAWLGRRLSLDVVWVQRHTAEYATPFEFRTGRYRVCTWGVADPHDRTFTHDAIVSLADLLIVRVGAGALPVVALLLTVAAGALSYIVLLPTIAAAIAIYGVYWTGRYTPPGHAA